MGKSTSIGWTDSTWNAWWGCTEKFRADGTMSPGCVNCYARFFATNRAGFNGKTKMKIWGQDEGRRFFTDKHWQEPFSWNALAKQGKKPNGSISPADVWLCFVNDMSDFFEDRRDLDPLRLRFFHVARDTPHITYQMLTKRPEKMLELAPDWFWRLPNVWAGTTCEDKTSFDERWPHLKNVPARVRFLSCEPLVGPLDLEGALGTLMVGNVKPGLPHKIGWVPERGVDWVIIGGESGHKRREMNLGALEHIVAQCDAYNVPVFVKQDSHMHPGQQGRISAALWARKEFPV